MKRAIQVATLFLDVGGVLLTSGWEQHARKRAATPFKLEWAEMNSRHHLPIEGIRGVLHTDYLSTRATLASFGLQYDEGVIHTPS